MLLRDEVAIATIRKELSVFLGERGIADASIEATDATIEDSFMEYLS